jgi:formylglycine-generating enzyme required for sulfatase activity
LEAVPGSETVSQLDDLPRHVFVTALADVDPLELVLFEPRSFTFGVSDADRRHEGELGAEEVTIATPFYLAVRETTQGQFQAFVDATQTDAGTAWLEAMAEVAPELQAQMPVVGVSHDVASQFCRWAGGRLPTEEQWEFAARGGTLRLYPWGDEPPTADFCNLAFAGSEKLMPANAFGQHKTQAGLLNLLGNAAEWCQNSYTPGYDEDPEDELMQGTFVVRGGSYAYPAIGSEVRVTSRAPQPPEGSIDVGFRLAVPIERSAPPSG